MGRRGSWCLLLLLHLAVCESSDGLKGLWASSIDGSTDLMHSWPIVSAGIFVLIALALSLFLIIEHLNVYNQPEEQKFLMVSVYATRSVVRRALSSSWKDKIQ